MKLRIVWKLFLVVVLLTLLLDNVEAKKKSGKKSKKKSKKDKQGSEGNAGAQDNLGGPEMMNSGKMPSKDPNDMFKEPRYDDDGELIRNFQLAEVHLRSALTKERVGMLCRQWQAALRQGGVQGSFYDEPTRTKILINFEDPYKANKMMEFIAQQPDVLAMTIGSDLVGWGNSPTEAEIEAWKSEHPKVMKNLERPDEPKGSERAKKVDRRRKKQEAKREKERRKKQEEVEKAAQDDKAGEDLQLKLFVAKRILDFPSHVGNNIALKGK